VLNHLFVPAIEAAGFEAVPPTASGSTVIHSHIISQLVAADLVLCDLSTRNPNVMFEMGVRTALNKPVAVVVDSHTKYGEVFDARDVQAHQYDADLSPWIVSGELPKLTDHLSRTLDKSDGTNPMWQLFGLREVATLSPTTDENRGLLLLQSEIEGLRRGQEATNNAIRALAGTNRSRLLDAAREPDRASGPPIGDLLLRELREALPEVTVNHLQFRRDGTVVVSLSEAPSLDAHNRIIETAHRVGIANAIVVIEAETERLERLRSDFRRIRQSLHSDSD